MFGPLAEQAIAKYSKPSHELLAVLQLFGATQKLVYRYAVENTQVIGFGKNKQGVVRVPIDDPIIVRPEQHLNIT
jgi:nitrate reductase beta subunit